MTPLQRATLPNLDKGQVRARAQACGISVAEFRRIMADMRENESAWLNDRYQVHQRDLGDTVWLSIKRIDQQPVTDWRDKQAIKNQLVGPECEGLELYPAESRCVDMANQFHLWVIKDPNHRIPCGFDGGRMVSGAPVPGGAQRELQTTTTEG